MTADVVERASEVAATTFELGQHDGDVEVVAG